MGYQTDFEGKLKFNKQLSIEDLNFLKGLASTRRMARNLDPKYGIEGEFFVNDDGMMGQSKDCTILDYNRPPKTQPSLWLQWVPTDDGWYLEWDGGDKFYCYVEWLEYLINKVLAPRGYILNGEIKWFGEDTYDTGVITVIENVVTTREPGTTTLVTGEVDNHQVYLAIKEVLQTNLGMKDEGGGDERDGWIGNVYSKGDYKVTIGMRN